MSDLGQTRVFGHATHGVVAIGLRRRPLSDLYHRLVTGSWTRLLLTYALVYFVTEALFEAAHYALEGAGAVPRGTLAAALVGLARGAPLAEVSASFEPRALLAGSLRGLEGFTRWAELVIGAGLVLTKFALLKARVLFSQVAVLGPHADGDALLFRIANERAGHVVDARLSVMLVRNELDEDGEVIRRAHDLPLLRGGTALFSHAWTAVHRVDRQSPLSGETPATLAAAEAELLVTFTGYDEGLSRAIHARHVYGPERIRWAVHFAPIVTCLPDGRRAVDYRRFHEVIPVEDPPAGTPRRARAG
ncbi:MAG: potassium transporter [Anaeromyxobacter sp.]